MAIEIEGNLDLEKAAKEIQDSLEKEFSKVRQLETGKMKQRIRSARDVNNAPMKLTPEYAAAKVRSGRNGIADLTWTGTLLNAIGTKIERVGSDLVGTIFIQNTSAPAPKIKPKTKQKRASAPKTRIVNTLDKARGLIDQGKKFFGLTQEQLTNITNKLKEALRK